MEAAQTIILSAMGDVKISGKLRRFLFWVGGPLFCLLILYGLRIYFGSSTNGAAETTGYPVYISDLFVSGNEVFMLRTRGESSIPRKYDIYRVGQDGQEQYVQPYPGKTAHWNKDTGKLYFLSGMEICEFDPVTGQCRSYLLERAYEKICAVEEEYVFLQSEIYGPVVLYSVSASKGSVIGASGWVLDVCDGHLFTWDVHKKWLTCYNYNRNQIVWAIDLSEAFSSVPILCRNDEDLYLANREGGNIYVIPQFADQGELEKLEISAPVIGMADAYDDIVYAVKNSQSICFYTLCSDGTSKKLTDWKEVDYYQDSSLMMLVHGEKLYGAVKTEESLFSCDLKS